MYTLAKIVSMSEKDSIEPRLRYIAAQHLTDGTAMNAMRCITRGAAAAFALMVDGRATLFRSPRDAF